MLMYIKNNIYIMMLLIILFRDASCRTVQFYVKIECGNIMQCQTGSMASLVESYEQQYSNLTAEIVSLTGTVPNLSGCKCTVQRVILVIDTVR